MTICHPYNKFFPRSKVPVTLLKKVSFFILWLLCFHPFLAAAQSFDIPKPSRPSHFTQGLIPQTQPISSAQPDTEDEVIRAVSGMAMSPLLPLNPLSFTMNPSSPSAASFTPVSTEVLLPFSTGWSPATGTFAGASQGLPLQGLPLQGLAFQGSVPLSFLPYQPLNTSVAVGNAASSRQAAQYGQGYALGGQQAAPVLMGVPSPYLPPTAYRPSIPYGNTYGNIFFTSTPYPQAPLSSLPLPPQPYPFSPTFGPII